jgi:hypothetical protein
VQLYWQRILRSVEDKVESGENTVAEGRRYPQLAQDDAQIPVPLSYLVPSERLKNVSKF